MIISWNTTQQCNLRCLHCYRDAGKKQQDELTTAEGKQLLNDIAAAGFKIMVFSGGEPLLRDDIFTLIAHAKSIGLRPVLGTNGVLLTKDVVKKLKAAGLAVAGISVDSLYHDKHDKFRNYPGAWQKTMDGILHCREEGLPFQLHTTVMSWNLGEVLDITDMAVELGARAHHIFFLVPTGRGQKLAGGGLNARQSEQLLSDILDKQTQISIELKPTCAPQFMRIAKEKKISLRFSRGCLAGIHYCVILPNGDVQPCPYLPLQVGNVRRQPFTEIWQTSEVFNILRQGKLKGVCGQCRYAAICGGCRARAYYDADGDYMAQDFCCSCMENFHKKSK